jgi:hypothetical protein
MTFADITATKALETELREEIAKLTGLLEAQPDQKLPSLKR